MESLGGALFVSVTGVVCVCLEIYLPGAILGLFGLGSAAYGAFLMYRVAGPLSAGCLLAADFAFGYFLFNLSLKVLPKTEAGRRIMLMRKLSGSAADPRDYEQLKGARGRVITVLRPTGTVEIEKKRYTARAETGIAESGAEIEVIAVDTNTLIVRQAESDA